MTQSNCLFQTDNEIKEDVETCEHLEQDETLNVENVVGEVGGVFLASLHSFFYQLVVITDREGR